MPQQDLLPVRRGALSRGWDGLGVGDAALATMAGELGVEEVPAAQGQGSGLGGAVDGLAARSLRILDPAGPCRQLGRRCGQLQELHTAAGGDHPSQRADHPVGTQAIADQNGAPTSLQ